MAMVKASTTPLTSICPKERINKLHDYDVPTNLLVPDNYEALSYALKWIDQAIRSSDDSQKQKLQDERDKSLKK